MTFKLAWRNIWRSRTRSLVVMGAVIIGIWAVIFLTSFSMGITKGYIKKSIQNEISHIQLHHPEFRKDRETKYKIEEVSETLKRISDHPNVEAVTARSLSNAMLSSSKGARGIRIKAIDPETESSVTKLETQLVDGKYLEQKQKNPILIGKHIAEKLNVKIRSKVVLTFQDMNGDITAGAFRIVGIFNTGNKAFDDAYVFLNRTDLNRLMGEPPLAHEIAIHLKDPAQLEGTRTELSGQFSQLIVETYREISPDISLFESHIKLSSYIFITIVMLALVFGIINTMLMAVLERIRELGMLMAIGMNKTKVFLMIVWETIMLGVIATPFGLLLGYFTVRYYNQKGIDLSDYSEGMRTFGMSEIIHPDMDMTIYIQLTIAVLITTILASIYPAYKAIKLRPVEAIRKL